MMLRILVLVLLTTTSALAVANYPSALDSNATGGNMAPVAAGDVIRAAESNLQTDAIIKLETAIGTDGDLTTGNTILDRLDTKLEAATIDDIDPRIINQSLNAAKYTGSDIGAKINAAIADCDTQVGVGESCRVFLPPDTYTITTSFISITRANTELNCQGSVIATGASWTDAALRVNIPTAGVSAAELLGVTVRNCTFAINAQLAITTLAGTSSASPAPDQRYGAVMVWFVTNLLMENIRVTSPIGSGVEIQKSTGFINNITVESSRLPYAGGKSTGLLLTGTGVGPAAGTRITATGTRVLGGAAQGIVAIAGVALRNTYVANPHDSCLALGGAATQGWVSVSGFEFLNCASVAATGTGAIDDGVAAFFPHDPLKYISISDGTIRNSAYGAIRFGHTDEYSNISIDNVTVECWGYASVNSNAVLIAPGSTGFTLRNSHINNAATCPATQMASAIAVAVIGAATDVEISNNSFDDGKHGIILWDIGGAITRMVIRNNVFRDQTNSPIYDAITVAGDQDIEISGNHFSNVCSDLSECGMLLLDRTSPGSVLGLTYTGNTARLLSSNQFGLESLTGWVPDQFIYSGNMFYTTANYDQNFDDNTVYSAFGNERIQTGLVLTEDSFGGPPTFARVQAGTHSISKHRAVCVTTTQADADLPFKVDECDTDDYAANTVIGVSTSTIQNNETGYVQVSGVAQVLCAPSTTINVVDQVMVSNSSGRVKAGSPGTGETLGKALSTCNDPISGYALVLLNVH